MKKYLFILATAAIVASCSDLDTFKKDIQNGNNEAISFASYSQPATRAENSNATHTWDFFTHHTTFEVWGYKNTEADAVFSRDVVTVAEAVSPATGYTYTYSPLRYWDKAATTYYFYAAAPSNANWVFTGVDDIASQNTGYFTTTSTLTGSNLISTPGADLLNSFKDATDKDKLIAEPCSVDKAKFGIEPVQLNFIHILSKLNVSIKKDNAKLASQTVTLKSIEINNLYNKASFDESTIDANLANGSNARWTKDNEATNVSYTFNTDNEIAATKKYYIESLVIPQDAEVELVALDGKHHDAVDAVKYTTLAAYNAAHENDQLTEEQWDALNTDNQTWEGYNEAVTDDTKDVSDADEFATLLATLIKEPAIEEIDAISDSSKPYMKIVYTIKDGNNTAEQFTAYFNLATAFKGAAAQASTLSFYEGWQNTLNIIISPDVIEFSADVYEWSTKTEKDLTVQ